MRSLVIPFFLLLRFSACCLALSFEWFPWRFLTLPIFPMLSFAFPRFLLFFCAREASAASPVCLVNEASPISWTLGLLVSWSLGLLVSLSLGFAAFWSFRLPAAAYFSLSSYYGRNGMIGFVDRF